MQNDDITKIEKILSFIIEVEKLKAVQRNTRPVGLERMENSAEHSWHVCLSALMLQSFADASVNIERVIKMLLIHDLGEIDVGDTIIYQSETAENKNLEAKGVERLLSMLPDGAGDNYLALWQEFEAGKTNDSIYAKAIDRIPPLLHNLHGDYHSWRKHKISKEQVLSTNSRIGQASESLWSHLKSQLEEVFDSGAVHQ
ncbi:HD domain-containing protein [Aliikangiella sp. IMCC44359]|uniref:HD domain-containing protein n=1 Tax=Aliikangiella sp. IMCC44359 TaxID=3459125 RepID=UPI00403AC72E